MLKPAIVVVVVTALAVAQAPPLPDKPQPQPAPQQKPEKQRILWLVPTIDVANARDPHVPLTPRDKFGIFTDSSFDRVTLVTAAFDAGINQATDTPEGYGQGAEGYAKRYGSAVADKVTSDFLGKFFYPAVFRQDPRYFRLAEGSGGRRAGYAMSRVLITRGDNGNRQFNLSQVLGAFSSAAMVNVWYPPRDRDLETTLTRGAGRLGLSMGFNLVKEFWPEIGRKVKLAR